MLIPRLLGTAIDLLRQGGQMPDVRRTAFMLAGAALTAFVMRFGWRNFVLGFCRGAETDLRQNLFAHLERLSSDFYIKYNTGDIITRAISDVTGIRFMFGMALTSLIDAGIVFTLAAFNMVNSAGPAMTAAAIAPVPFLIFFIARIRKELRGRQRAIRTATSHMASKVQENLTGIHVVKGFAREFYESGEFSARSKNKWKTEMRMARLSSLIGPLIQTAFGAVFTLFIVFGSRMIAEGSMTLGQFTAFNGYILLMVNPVANIGQAIERWQNGLASITRLDEILLYPPEVYDDADAVSPDAKVGAGRIELRGLSYAYPGAGKPVLRDISIDIRPGEAVAVTGPTGCGKSTLVSLLARQWALEGGMVYVDGQDVNRIPVRALRAAMGYVPQDNFLFSVSIRDNIRFYDESLSDEDVYAAAAAVSVHDSIMSFSDGYDTIVGERGVTLSGGQMQRIAIARALARRPKLLLLDDCFSAVDAETEQSILAGLRGYLRETTAIIITHRVASAALADRILVLDEGGALAELGTYDELVAAGGRFCTLVRKQTGQETGQETGREGGQEAGQEAGQETA
jgi:ATP-binding cassette subfamily B protein